MSTQHRDQHDDWLNEWQAEGHLGDSQRSELLDCESCNAGARNIQGVLSTLEEHAARVRDGDSASRMASPDLEGEVETNLRLFMAATPPKERRGLASWALRLAPWLGLAATLLILFLVNDRETETQPTTAPSRGETWLSAEEFELLEPRGSGAEFSVFRWRTNLEGVEYHVLTIWDADDLESDPLTKEIEDGETQWTPEDEERGTLPIRIRWQVSAHDLRQITLGVSDFADASRRSD